MKDKTKILTLLMVFVMAAVCVVPAFSEGSEAASGDGGSYSYTITYSPSTMSSSSAAISVDGMTPISHSSTTAFESLNAGSWTWNTTTGLGPFNSFYAAFDANNGNAFVSILNPSDLSKKLDGSGLGSGTYNIMWVLPTVYWKVDSSGNLTLTNDSTAGGIAYAHTINGHVYKYIALGVYEGSTATIGGNTVLTSTTGSTPTASQTRETFQTYAHNYSMASSLNESNSYPAYSMIWNFYQWELYKYCCFATMEDFNSQAIVGGGHTYGSTYAFTTGSTDSMGAYAGYALTGTSADSTTGGSSVKLFLENAWGGVREFVGGVVVNGTSGFYLNTSDNPTDTVTKDTTNTYTEYITTTLPSSGYATSINTDAKIWGFANNTGGSATTGLADYTYTSSSSDRSLSVGGTSGTFGSTSVSYGVSCANASDVLSSSAAIVGSRLAFVFDAGPAAKTTVTVTASPNGYGSVSTGSVSNVLEGSTITVSGNQITVGGTTITATPTTATAEYTYAFSGWSVSNGDTVTANMSITASFTRTTNNYTVTIAVNDANYGSVSNSSVTVPYGTAISSNGNVLSIGSTNITATPTTDTDQYDYAFSSWTGASGTVTGAKTITANFTRTTINYTVTVAVNDGTYGSVSNNSVTVPYGTSISAASNVLSIGSTDVTATPSADTAQYDYGFGSWSGIPVSGTVTGNVTITANFTRATLEYTVTITVNNSNYGSVDTNSVTVPYGTPISSNGNVLTIGSTDVTATPTTATDQYTYTVSSWSNIPAGGTVTGDITVTANFAQFVRNYTVTITVNPTGYGSVNLSSVTVPYGTAISSSDNVLTIGGTNITATAASPTTENIYAFSSWTGASGTVTADKTITANFTQSVRNYTVTIAVNNGTYGSVSNNSVTVPYGTSITANESTLTIGTTNVTATPTTATDEFTYGFGAWSNIPAGGTVTGTLTVTANFTRTTNQYTVTIATTPNGYGSVDTNSVTVDYGSAIVASSNELTIGSTTVTATAANPTAQYTFHFGSWTGIPVSGTVTGAVTITANFTTTTNQYTVTITVNDGTYGSVDENSVTVDYGTSISAASNVLSIGSTDVTATASADTAQYDYGFGSWSNIPVGGEVIGNVTVTANFTRDIQQYTALIQSNNPNYGTVDVSTINDVDYDSQIHIDGSKLTLAGTVVTATPTASDVYYTYGFDGWEKDGQLVQDGDPVRSDVTIIANFSAEVVTYIIMIQPNNPDYGSVSVNQILGVTYGTTIGVSGNTLTIDQTSSVATPTANDAHYNYSFVGWSVANNDTVNGNMVITANFTATVRNYTVTVQSNDTGYGTVSSGIVANVPYGTPISAAANVLSVGSTGITATPTTDTDQYDYGFSEWSNIPAGGEVVGDVTITANFTRDVKQYTVTIATTPNGYGSVDTNSVTVDYGTSISALSNVLSVGSTNVTATPTTATAEHTYSFGSWSNIPVGGEVVADVTVTASFTRAVNQYTITIAANPSGYGSVSNNSVTVDYGTAISSNGSTLTIGSTNITATPTTATDEFTYSFDSWTGASGTVTGAKTITANFTRTTNTYTVTILVNDSNYGSVDTNSVTVPYGTSISSNGPVLMVGANEITATPTPNTAEYSYAFDSWTGASGTVTGAKTITANFTRGPSLYTVTITATPGGYGTVSASTVAEVPYGTTIAASGDTLTVGSTDVTATPSLDTQQYDYAFSGWTGIPVGGTITENTAVTANFTRTTNQYSVTILVNESDYGSVDETSVTVDFGTSISAASNILSIGSTDVTATPTTDTQQYDYGFGSWSGIPVSGSVEDDVTITANFTRAVKEYMVIITVSPGGYGTVTAQTISSIPYGTSITADDNVLSIGSTDVTATPSTDTAQYTYSFVNWTGIPADNQITDRTEISANFERETRTYTVTWIIEGSSSTETYPYGETPTHADPVVEGKRFLGWSPEIVPVTQDATYTAQFEDLQPWTVTFNATANGGRNLGVSSKIVYQGLTYGALPNAVKTNNVFLGWFTAVDGGTNITPDTIVDLTGDITLYAHFSLPGGLSAMKTVIYLIPTFLFIFVAYFIVNRYRGF